MSHKDYDVQNKFELVKFKDRHTSYVLQTECGGIEVIELGKGQEGREREENERSEEVE